MRQDRKHLASRIGVRAISILALVGMLASLGKAQHIISTIAGGGPPNGAKATSVGLQPVGIAVDAAGNQYISSQSDGRVYKVDTAGTVTVLAGGGSYGYSGGGGPATRARIWDPSGVAGERAGNVYIADTGNNRIRKVDTNGVITTVAGNGTYGYSGEGGQAIGAQLADASGVAVDSVGNLYIADTANSRIRKVDTGGMIITVAGNGGSGYSGDGGLATSAELPFPQGIGVDRVGNLYIVDFNNKRTRKVLAQNGVINTVAGNGTSGYSGDSGTATGAQLNGPLAV